MGKIYLYLLKRNKGDVKIIGSLVSQHVLHASRLTDLDVLGLSVQERLDLKKVIEFHRIDWEPWIESAESYHELREKLNTRGISAPPSPNAPLINLSISEISKATSVKLNKNKIMTRRMN